LPAFRQVELDYGTQELVRQLQEDAGTVTRGGLGTRGTSMLQVGQRCQSIAHDAVGTPALDVGHHGDTTGVALISGVVKTLGAGDGGEDHCADLLRRPRVKNECPRAQTSYQQVGARDDGGPRVDATLTAAKPRDTRQWVI
jgi:hypothetical protein